jgi:hypothetical protein
MFIEQQPEKTAIGVEITSRSATAFKTSNYFYIPINMIQVINPKIKTKIGSTLNTGIGLFD